MHFREKLDDSRVLRRYFSETHIVPSPWNENDSKPTPLVANASPASTVATDTKELCDGWSQTVLSLPPTLPKELEDALRPYFTFTQEQDDRNSSLCRRLFYFNEETVSSVHESEASEHSDLSVIGSPVKVVY